jgi:hypothetical protein
LSLFQFFRNKRKRRNLKSHMLYAATILVSALFEFLHCLSRRFGPHRYSLRDPLGYKRCPKLSPKGKWYILKDYRKVKEESNPNITEEVKTTCKPTLLLHDHASKYTSAVKNYVETYQEGLNYVLDE